VLTGRSLMVTTTNLQRNLTDKTGLRKLIFCMVPYSTFCYFPVDTMYAVFDILCFGAHLKDHIHVARMFKLTVH
jgi:hypothetical protein